MVKQVEIFKFLESFCNDSASNLNHVQSNFLEINFYSRFTSKPSNFLTFFNQVLFAKLTLDTFPTSEKPFCIQQGETLLNLSPKDYNINEYSINRK